ncbi:MAG: type III ribulose-bisphosphate carboxylase [Candidatus Altiarchaeales archaeon WOR_SM1_86-2]|nr:MAG: type III ribulose-bisphosphate carboxylase [Candidatus Altiarchaeales archaeon WOR_SM1_86-2]
MVKKIEWYHEFIDENYIPKSDDIKVLFYYEPADGVTREDAIGRIASESSSGTWTTLAKMPALLPKTKAYAYEYTGNYVKIAYPGIIFEEGSIPGLLASIGGNIFGMKAVRNLRLMDATLPLDFIKHFKGAYYGRDAIKAIFKKTRGPITSVVPKPKLGYTAREHAEVVANSVWRGGMDCVKDDENLTDQKFNKLGDRVKHLAKVRDKVMAETGEVKDAFINVTSPDLKELEKRVKLVHDHGFNYFMLDVVVSGFGEVGTACELAHDYKMAIHAHRAMHSMFTRNRFHGMTMLFFAKLLKLLGVDQLHTGTVVGKLEGPKKEIAAIKDTLIKKDVGGIKNMRMPQEWGKIKPILPVASGGLHPGILPEVFDIYNTTDIVLQLGGGTLGHPDGIESGARAVVQAIEAYKAGIKLDEYSETHKELRRALEKWRYLKPV